ncbi:hypothetical protein J132_02746 [Termitomyces sp. J132]|nr:hypothetical protein J132_02746 [Termitomyces sp. J132]
MQHHEHVAVFWDFGTSFSRLKVYAWFTCLQRIYCLAHDFGVIISFKAYLEVSSTLRLWTELQASGVALIDCPHHRGAQAAGKMLLVDLIAFAIDHPTPATIFLISGDRDFAYAVSTLRHRKYKVVILCPPDAHSSLVAQADVHLDWNAKVLRENQGDESSVAPPPVPQRARHLPTSVNRVTSDSDRRAIVTSIQGLTQLVLGELRRERLLDRIPPLDRSDPRSRRRKLRKRLRLPPGINLREGFPFSENETIKELQTAQSSTSASANAVVKTPPSVSTSLPAPSVETHNSWKPSTPAFVPAALAAPVTLTSAPSTTPIPAPVAIISSTPLLNTKTKPVLPTPSTSAQLLSSPPVVRPPPQTTNARPAPSHFLPLITALQKRAHEKMQSQVMRTDLGSDLAKVRNLYAQAKVSKFASYVLLAEEAGIIKSGGSGNEAWAEWAGGPGTLPTFLYSEMPSEDVAIFWDYENCAAAAQYTGYEIVKKIRHVAHYFGTIKLFKAYLELSDPATFAKSLVLRSELQCSGVSLTDCPHNGRKDVADKMILVDMLAYAIDNPPPSTIILISGDRDFAYAVSVLRLRRYRVVIISLPGIHTSLKTQASFFLDWNNDVLAADVVDDSWSPHDGRLPPQEDYRTTSVSHSQRERNRNFPSFLRRAGRSNGEAFDIDIMDHLRYKGNGGTALIYGPLDSRVSRGDISKETPQLATPTSHEAGDSSPMTRSPSQTESVPATLLTDETSLTPTIVGKPSPAEDEEESAVGGYDAYLSTPETQSPAQKTPLVENIPPIPTLSNQGSSHQQTPSTLGTTPNVVPTSPPSSLPPIPPYIQPNPVSEVLPTPNGNTASTSTPPTDQSQPKVVPPQFSLLVQRLQFHRSKGFSRPFRSGVATELASKDNMVYRRAGTERFGQYVALAEKAGIIELGGKEGGAWIALRPEWYNTKIG